MCHRKWATTTNPVHWGTTAGKWTYTVTLLTVMRSWNEEMKERNEEIEHNALMSSVLETLDKMSKGILDRSFYGLLIY